MFAKKLVAGLIVLLVVGGWSFWSGTKNKRPESLGQVFSCDLPLFSRPGVASSTLVTTGNNMVLPTSSVREYVSIFNNGNDSVALNFGDAAAAGKGHTLAPSTTLEISPCGTLYTKNSIQATMDSGGGSATLQLFFKHVAE